MSSLSPLPLQSGEESDSEEKLLSEKHLNTHARYRSPHPTDEEEQSGTVGTGEEINRMGRRRSTLVATFLLWRSSFIILIEKCLYCTMLDLHLPQSIAGKVCTYLCMYYNIL